MPAFAPGDQVAWSHEHAPDHASGSVIRESAARAWPQALIGEVVEAANPQGTWWTVRFPESETSKTIAVTGEDGTVTAVEHGGAARFRAASASHPDADCLTLTSHELVKVGEN